MNKQNSSVLRMEMIMDKEEFYVENKEKTLAAYCTEDGKVVLKKINTGEVLFIIDVFCENYKEWKAEWCVEPRLAFSPTNEILAVAYGMGWLYLIDIDKKCVCRHFRFFPEVNYENSSFQEIDMCCYYNEYTQLDFSCSGKYLAIRVRVIYDPQESDGRIDLFTPIYMRSVFVIDMDIQEKIFDYYYSDKTERYYHENLAVLTFSPDDKILLIGALGGLLKVFELKNGIEVASFEHLGWISDPCAVDDRALAVFLDNTTFIYVAYIYDTKQTLLIKAAKTDIGWQEIGRYDVVLCEKYSLVTDVNYDKTLRKIVLHLGMYPEREKILLIDKDDV